jgi:hypothetical protein
MLREFGVGLACQKGFQSDGVADGCLCMVIKEYCLSLGVRAHSSSGLEIEFSDIEAAIFGLESDLLGRCFVPLTGGL